MFGYISDIAKHKKDAVYQTLGQIILILIGILSLNSNKMFYITHSLPTLQFTDLVLSSWTSGTRRDKTAINIEFCFFLQLLGATKYIDFTKSLDEIFL